MIAGPIPILLKIHKNPNNTEAVATTPKSYGVSKRANIIEITIETENVKPTKIVEHNNFTTDGPYMAASIYKVLSDEKSKLEQDFKNLAHDESNIKMLDSQRSNVTKKILKPYMVSKLITSIFK